MSVPMPPLAIVTNGQREDAEFWEAVLQKDEGDGAPLPTKSEVRETEEEELSDEDLANLTYRERLALSLLSDSKYPPRAGEGTRRAIDRGETVGEKKFKEREAIEKANADERKPKVPKRLTDDDDDVVNLPDIADVSFPSMVGAIPSKPKRRKKVRYQGVSLSRRPTDFEAYVLSLSAIPRRYDEELTRVVADLADVRRDHLADLLRAAVEDRSELAEIALSRTEDVLRDAQDRMARYGVFELRNECRRQGLALAPLTEDAAAFDRVADLPVLLESSRLMAEAMHSEWMSSIERLSLKMLRTKRARASMLELAEGKVLAGLKNHTRHLLHESFGVPRQAYIRKISAAAELSPEFHLARRTPDEEELEEIVDYVIQSAVMDSSTCDECADADNLTFDYGDDDMDYYAPPYVNCLGGDNCRCVQIYVLTDGEFWVVREDRII